MQNNFVIIPEIVYYQKHNGRSQNFKIKLDSHHRKQSPYIVQTGRV